MGAKTQASTSGTGILQLNECKPALESPEAAARAAASRVSLTKAEVLSRLIFSESLSTGFWKKRCSPPDDGNQLMQAIGWGIMNRVSKQPHSNSDSTKPYYDVVFAPNQFVTSFSIAKGKANPFAESFLCPLMSQDYLNQAAADRKISAAELYAAALKIAEQIVQEYDSAGKLPDEYKGITNFFYPRSEYFGELRPKWAPNSDATKNPGYLNLFKSKSGEHPCAEFYHL
jgi:hypothetical protein